MAVAFVAEKVAATHVAAATSFTIPTLSPTSGDLLVIALSMSFSSINTSHAVSASDANGNTWSLATGQTNPSTIRPGVALLYTFVTHTPTGTITVSCTNGSNLASGFAYKVEEFSGVLSYDISNGNQGASTQSPSTPSVTPAAGGELAMTVYAAETLQGANGFSPPSGYTGVGQSTGSVPEIGFAYEIGAGVGAQSPSCLWAVSTTNSQLLAFFKPVPDYVPSEAVFGNTASLIAANHW